MKWIVCWIRSVRVRMGYSFRYVFSTNNLILFTFIHLLLSFRKRSEEGGKIAKTNEMNYIQKITSFKFNYERRGANAAAKRLIKLNEDMAARRGTNNWNGMKVVKWKQVAAAALHHSTNKLFEFLYACRDSFIYFNFTNFIQRQWMQLLN